MKTRFRSGALLAALLVASTLFNVAAAGAGEGTGDGVLPPENLRINPVANNGATILYPADTHFFLSHGWGCDTDGTQVSNAWGPCDELKHKKSRVLFFMSFGTKKVRTLGADRLDPFPCAGCNEPGVVQNEWFVDFPDGVKGGSTRTFGAVHMWNGEIHQVDAVTVKFVDGLTRSSVNPGVVDGAHPRVVLLQHHRAERWGVRVPCRRALLPQPRLGLCYRRGDQYGLGLV